LFYQDLSQADSNQRVLFCRAPSYIDIVVSGGVYSTSQPNPRAASSFARLRALSTEQAIFTFPFILIKKSFKCKVGELHEGLYRCESQKEIYQIQSQERVRAERNIEESKPTSGILRENELLFSFEIKGKGLKKERSI
jgi:hypothetical protein